MKTNSIFLQNVFTFKNLPVEQKQRKWTDCCCTIFTGIFAFILFILSFVMFTKNNYYQLNFPADDNGKTCYNELHDYPFMYFTNPQNPISGRCCLKQCPKNGQQFECSDKKNLKISSYDTYPEVNKIGAFCSPSDFKMRNKLFSGPELGNKLALTHGYDAVRFAILVGFLVGIIYLAVIGCLGGYLSFIIFPLTSIFLIITALYILFKPINLFQGYFWTILIALILIIFAVGYLIYYCYNKEQIQLSSILLNHSNTFLKQTWLVYLYIPLFMLFTFAFIVLIIWQYIAFGTGNQPFFEKQNIYYHSNHKIFLQILNVIQLIWGLQFLRDSFSGNAVEWYFKSMTRQHHCGRPFGRLVKKHWGSVVGGSFLNAFFKVFDVFGDFFRCDRDNQYGRCSYYYEKFCCCNSIFQFMRSDAYSYINLTGIPFCNAARQCQALCRYTNLSNSSQSAMKSYRNAVHICIIGLSAFICYIIFESKTSQYGSYDHFWIALAVVLAVYSMGTYFIDINLNGAQAIFITYLTEQNCQGENEMKVCPGDLKKDIINYRATFIKGYNQIV